MKRLLILFILFITILSNMVFASNLENNEAIKELNYENVEYNLWEQNQILNPIYKTPSKEYIMYSSELIDIYIISCALYFDFESQELLPSTQYKDYYKEVKEYFSKYKNNNLISQKYVDVDNKSVNPEVMHSLLMYSFSKTDYSMEIGMLHNNTFKDAYEFNSFLRDLYNFYITTNAKEFFEDYYPCIKMKQYLKENLPKIQVGKYINTMEEYVGNKDVYYGDKNVKYRSVMTIFRPFNASFYSVYMDNDIYLITQQSPNDSSKNPQQFDIKQTINTIIHEFLHNYINTPVYNQNELIERLSVEKQKGDYAGQMYQEMQWNRIVDENIVRAVEAAIYGEIYNNKDKAFDEILKKEIEFGGFKHVQKIYDSLKEYEINRYKYKTINEYIPNLINVMFS